MMTVQSGTGLAQSHRQDVRKMPGARTRATVLQSDRLWEDAEDV